MFFHCKELFLNAVNLFVRNFEATNIPRHTNSIPFHFIVTLISGDLQDGGLRDEDAGRRVDAGETNW